MNTKKAWLVALATIFAGVALALVQNKVAPCMLVLQEALNIDMATVGWLSSVFSLVGIIIAIPAAVILNKVGPKKGGIIALACAIGGTLIGLFVENTTVLMISRVIEGMGVGLMSVIGPAIIAMWFPEAKRGLPMSIWAVYQMCAQAIMFFLGAVLTTNFGWQGMWWFGLAACVVALVFYVVCVKSPRPEDSYADVESEDVSIAEGIKSPYPWLMAVVTMFFCIACFGFVNWVATSWTELYGWTLDEANNWVACFSLGAVFAAIILGSILNKVRNQKAFGAIALAFYGFIVIWGMVIGSPMLIVPFVIIYAFADSGFPCVLWTMTALTVKKPELAGVALGIVSIGFNLGILLGPPIIGAIAQSFGWSVAAFAMCGCCLVAAVLLLPVKLYSTNAEQQPASRDPEVRLIAEEMGEIASEMGD